MVTEAWLKKLLPYESHYLTVGGFKMHYLDEGPEQDAQSAPVVLLLHGNPTWSFYYRHLIAALRPHFRVIAPDYIGCGLSERPNKAHFRASHRIQQVSEFVEKLGLKKYSLVMHDWGGSIGTGFAIRNSASVQALVYLNTTLTETEMLPGVIKLAATPLIGKWITKYTKFFIWLTTNWGVSRKLPKIVKRGYSYPYRSRAARASIWDFVADIPFESSHPSYSEMLELAEGLPKLTSLPVQIVWGLQDICFHREMLNKVAEQFPRAQVLEIAEAAHLVLEDAPETANAAIFGFLSDVERGRVPVAPAAAVEEAVRGNALYESFVATAARHPHDFAAISPLFIGSNVRYEQVTYQDLKALVDKYQRGLSKLGLRSGDRVLMLVSPGVDFLALSYAVMGRGAVPFYLDPGMGKEKLLQCIQEINPQVFIGSPKAQILRLFCKKLFANLKFSLTASEWVYLGNKNLAFLKRFAAKTLPKVRSSGTALVAFTSGATGIPKGVIFTDEMVREQLRIFIEVFGFTPGNKDLPLLPIFSLFTVAIGVTSVFPPLDPARPLAVDPLRVVKLVKDLSIKYSFGSPTLWLKIAEYCIRSRATLGSLERIFMAGAPVPPSTIEKVRRIAPNSESFTPYGATEALPVTLVSGTEVLKNPAIAASSGEVGTLVGKAVPGVRVKVVQAVAGEIGELSAVASLEPYEIGEVIVCGANVSPAYFERGEATALAKIREQGSFWHRMGDLGYLDEVGRLYFCGRKVHAHEWQGRTFYSIPVERIFNEHPKVYRSALLALHGGKELALAIEPGPEFWPESSDELRLFLDELRQIALQNPLTAPFEKFFIFRAFPVDPRHNAKIYRDRLGESATQLDLQGLRQSESAKP